MGKRKMFFKRMLAFLMVFVMTLSGTPVQWLSKVTGMDAEAMSSVSAASAAASYNLTENIKDGAILHAWCWSFQTIKENMKDIAEAGYSTVQTSPANECKATYPTMKLMGNDEAGGTDGCWWWQYQPTDWKIGNYQLGTRQDFIDMCNEADKYGIKIIVDVIPNHTSPDQSVVSKDLFNAAGGNLYHQNGFKDIQDGGEWSWGNREACTTGRMGGLPDVDTENQGFQAYFVTYLNDLIACGCDGFRYDTAKHIGAPSDPKDPGNTRGVNDFWDVATGKKSVNGVTLSDKDRIFTYGEVLQGDNVPEREYAQYMNMTASSYGGKLRDLIGKNDFSTGSITNWEHQTPDSLVTWVESHDTYCNGHESGWMTDEQIRLCWAVIAARKQGTPLFYSRPDGSNGHDGNYWGYNVLGAKGNDQFKAPEVVAVNFFRNAMTGESEYLRNPNGSSQILQIDRGTKGTCIINLGEGTDINTETSMEDGTYTDQVSKRTFTVSGGKISGHLDGRKVAVIYNATEPNPNRASVGVTSATGSDTFQKTLSVKLTAQNVTGATYETTEGKSGSFSDGDTITVGSSLKDGESVTVTVKGQGEDGEVTASKTFKKQKSVVDGSYDIFFKKPSGWGSTIYCYAYKGETKNAEWPGVEMVSLGEDTYGYNLPDGMTSASIIFNDKNQQDPAQDADGLEYTKGTSVLYLNGSFTKVEIPDDDEETKTGTVIVKHVDVDTEESIAKDVTLTGTVGEAYQTSTVNVPGYALESEPQNASGKYTENTITVVYRYRGGLTGDYPIIQHDETLQDGGSFDTETATVHYTLRNSNRGTYSVDGGPVKEFTSEADVVIGQGKIADSDITVTVTASNDKYTETQTFTYHKKFNYKKNGAYKEYETNAEGQLTVKNSYYEESLDSTKLTAPASSYYATNPNGQTGQKKTITKASDFDDSMIIAQGVANDDPAAFRGTHEAPKFDPYALYGAWDDTNLYLGIQYTNVIDVVDPAQSSPQTGRGKPNGADADIPQMIVFDLGTGDYTDGSTNDTVQKTVWNSNIHFSGDAKVDKVLMYSPKEGISNWALFPVTGGLIDYDKDKAIAPGYQMPFEGASLTWEDTFMGSTMMGINANGNGGYTPADLESSASKWVNFLTTDHSTEHDTFCILTLSLDKLGVTADDIASKGIGVMAVATYGSSGVGCLPMDMTMLDAAQEAYSQDDSTSAEKEDEDTITVPLARLGAARKTDGGTDGKTDGGADGKTDEGTAGKTDGSKGVMTVNFGADRSAPQAAGTALKLEAVAGGGSGDYSYEFYVDDKKVQNASAKTSYTWEATGGKHTIKVVVTDLLEDMPVPTAGDTATDSANGTLVVTCSKDYTIEGDGEEEDNPNQPVIITESDVTIAADNLTYNGREISPAVTVTVNGKSLVQDTDYTVKYANHVNAAAGNAANAPTVTVTGKGNYTGTVSKTFTIAPADTTPAGAPSAAINAGQDQNTVGDISLGTGWQWETADSTKSLQAGSSVTATAVYTGSDKANYTKNSVTVTITKAGSTQGDDTGNVVENTADLANAIITVLPTNLYYNGQEQKPAVVVTLGGKTLTKETDYKVRYSNNINAADENAAEAPTIFVIGTGTYTGNTTKSFTISKSTEIPVGAPAAALTAGQDDNVVGDIALNPGWQWSTTDVTKELAAGGTVMAAAVYVGSDKANYLNTGITVSITKAASTGGNTENGTVDIGTAVVTVADAVYNGQPQKPVVTVTLAGKQLEENGDYRLYYTHNVNAADQNAADAPTVSVYGIGDYNGTARKSFTIHAAETIPAGAPDAAIQAQSNQAIVGDIALNANWEWADRDIVIELKAGTTVSATAIYTGNDKANYKNNTVIVSITKVGDDTTGGDTTGGDTNGGDTTEDGTTEGNTTGGDTTGGDTTGGNTTGDDTTEGNTTGGDTTGGDTTGGNTTGDDTTGGDTTGDNTTGGGTTGGNTTGGNTTGGDATGGNKVGGDTTGGNTTGGNTAGGDTTGGNTTGGNTGGNTTGGSATKDTDQDVEIGDIIEDAATNGVYRVSGMSAVEYTMPLKKAGSVKIPSEVTIAGDVYKVTAIAESAFKSDKKLQSVKIGSNVKTIRANAFNGCKNLTKVVMNSKVTKIESKAFYKCEKLASITIPSKISKIGTKAFYGCKKLKSITIKTTSLTKSRVGSNAFKGIYARAAIKVPAKKLNSYKRILKARGVGSRAKITK